MSWPGLSHAEMTRRIVLDNYTQLEGDRLLNATVEENVLVQLENLRTLPAVGSRLVRGDLHLHGWFYKIETGEVFAYEPRTGQFVPLAEYRIPETEMASRSAHRSRFDSMSQRSLGNFWREAFVLEGSITPHIWPQVVGDGLFGDGRLPGLRVFREPVPVSTRPRSAPL